jgi:hypothetical protein
VWNEDTKLAAYITIWYLGNIYCESGFFGGGVLDGVLSEVDRRVNLLDQII